MTETPATVGINLLFILSSLSDLTMAGDAQLRSPTFAFYKANLVLLARQRRRRDDRRLNDSVPFVCLAASSKGEFAARCFAFAMA